MAGVFHSQIVFSARIVMITIMTSSIIGNPRIAFIKTATLE